MKSNRIKLPFTFLDSTPVTVHQIIRCDEEPSMRIYMSRLK